MLRVPLVLPRACCAPDPLMWGFLLSGTRALPAWACGVGSLCCVVCALGVRARSRGRVVCALVLCCVCARIGVLCGVGVGVVVEGVPCVTARVRVRACACVLWACGCGCVWVCGCPPPWSPGWEGGWGACCFCVVVLWRCPTLPRPVDRSTIGVTGLSFQVRNVAGRFPGAMTTTNFVSNLTDPARHQRSRACVGVRVGVG